MVSLEIKIDKHGFEYLDKLPAGYHLANLDDFHIKGKKKVGMGYLVRWSCIEYYEIRVINETTNSGWLKQFIDDDRVYVQD